MNVTVPFPIDDEVQKVESYSFGSAMTPEKLLSVSLERGVEYGNRLLQIRVLDPAPNDELSFKYVIVRKEKSNPLGAPFKNNAFILPAEKQFLEPGSWDSAQANQENATLVQTIVKPGMSRDQEIEAIYRYVLSLPVTDSAENNNSTIWPLASKWHKPVDFSIVATDLAQAGGIAAKFETGITIPEDQQEGTIIGVRHWTNLYHPQRGWVPIDPIGGLKTKHFADYYLGRIGSDRITFVIGREREAELYNRSGEVFMFPRAYYIGSPVSKNSRFRLGNSHPYYKSNATTIVRIIPMKMQMSFKRLPALNPMIAPD